MSEFVIYFEIGLHHVLDIRSYDHLLFLIALTIPYTFKDWRKIALLISLFTVGHTISLILTVFNLAAVNRGWIDLLIPVIILSLAGYHLVTAGKANNKHAMNWLGFIALFFGIVHGLGLSNYFDEILIGDAADKLLPLFEFAVGIQLGQCVVVLMVLLIWFIVHHFGRFSKRDFAMVVSALVIGAIIPLAMNHEF